MGGRGKCLAPKSKKYLKKHRDAGRNALLLRCVHCVAFIASGVRYGGVEGYVLLTTCIKAHNVQCAQKIKTNTETDLEKCLHKLFPSSNINNIVLKLWSTNILLP